MGICSYSRWAPGPGRRPIATAAMLAVMLLAPAAAGAVDDPTLERIIRGIEAARAPQIVSGHLLLTYATPQRLVRYVGARFAHESFGRLHLFQRNEHDVMVLPLPLPPDQSRLVYRIVVDGLWRPDPSNPMRLYDAAGIGYSVVEVPPAPPRPAQSPVSNPDGTVTFRLRAEAGRRVTVVGDFSVWDPFLYRLHEQPAERSGSGATPLPRAELSEYSTTIRMAAGRHYYYFTVDGARTLDPMNINTARDANGASLSTFIHSLPPAPTVDDGAGR